MLNTAFWVIVNIVLILFSLTMISLHLHDKKIKQQIKNKREEK